MYGNSERQFLQFPVLSEMCNASGRNEKRQAIAEVRP
jgi:hypothetical protein